MYIPFDEIDFEARVWVYQSDKSLSPDTVTTLTETLKAALDGWEAHGKPLIASGKVFYNRFVVIAADESHEQPSGCAIDKSTHWLKEAGRIFNVDFFDRSVAWLDEHQHVHTAPLADVKRLVGEEEITPATIVFDNLVATKAQWMKRWKVPAGTTWLKRYFEAKDAEAL